MSANTAYVTNEEALGLPPLRAARRAVWDSYRIEFLPDGYPGRRTDRVLYAHPLYGPYVIADYIYQYRLTKNFIYLEAAMRVADAAISRMTPIGGGLAFVYSQETSRVSSKKGEWYSGLTQARYIDALSRLTAFPGTDRFCEPLSGILASFDLPVAQGGVARLLGGHGLLIEEYPSLVPDCTLNGWTTATVILRNFAKASDDAHAWELFYRSVVGLESLVHLYDVPQLATSRYKLKGPAVIYLQPEKVDVTVRSIQIDLPGLGVFPANTDQDAGGSALASGARWVENGEKEAFKVELSRSTSPNPNIVRFSIESSGKGVVKAHIGEGDYDPMTSRLAAHRESHLGTFRVTRESNVLEVAVPWEKAELVAYPTNFGKAIADRQFNQYHWIHVDTLSAISAEVDSGTLRHFSERWREYPARWGNMPEYQDSRITLERFDPKVHF